MSVPTAGLYVKGTGLTIDAGGLAATGDVRQTFGALSVTASTAAASGISVLASHAAFTGNVIGGSVSAGDSTSNVLLLLEGSNSLFSVRIRYSVNTLLAPCSVACVQMQPVLNDTCRTGQHAPERLHKGYAGNGEVRQTQVLHIRALVLAFPFFTEIALRRRKVVSPVEMLPCAPAC